MSEDNAPKRKPGQLFIRARAEGGAWVDVCEVEGRGRSRAAAEHHALIQLSLNRDLFAVALCMETVRGFDQWVFYVDRSGVCMRGQTARSMTGVAQAITAAP